MRRLVWVVLLVFAALACTGPPGAGSAPPGSAAPAGSMAPASSEPGLPGYDY